MATMDFQPKFRNINAMPQSHGSATNSMGGAAKFVKEPPIEILTNKSATVAY